jgi:hypothetical protein
LPTTKKELCTSPWTRKEKRIEELTLEEAVAEAKKQFKISYLWPAAR